MLLGFTRYARACTRFTISAVLVLIFGALGSHPDKAPLLRVERSVLFIQTTSELEDFCKRAQASNILALDTEFLREKTFHPKLCLIQLATSADDIVCVDPFSIADTSALVTLLKNPAITKIIHSCSQDIEVLDVALDCVPTPVFDTQIAAAFLGYRMQMGYGPMVEAFEGVHLAKAESHTDWSRRPLDPEQLVYAEDDVRYLPSIYEQMVRELIAKDRLNWVLPEMQSYVQSLTYKLEPSQSYKHLKRVSSLSGPQLAIAQRLCIWRDNLAAKLDIPRKWILSDELLVEISKRAPKDAEALHRMRGAEQLNERNTDSILHAVQTGKNCPKNEWPERIKHVLPSAEQESVLDLMYSMLRIISANAGIATQIIATRDDLFAFMQHDSKSSLSSGWRYELAGKKLEGLLSGSCGLTIKEGHVEIL